MSRAGPGRSPGLVLPGLPAGARPAGGGGAEPRADGAAAEAGPPELPPPAGATVDGREQALCRAGGTEMPRDRGRASGEGVQEWEMGHMSTRLGYGRDW